MGRGGYQARSHALAARGRVGGGGGGGVRGEDEGARGKEM